MLVCGGWLVMTNHLPVVPVRIFARLTDDQRGMAAGWTRSRPAAGGASAAAVALVVVALV